MEGTQLRVVIADSNVQDRESKAKSMSDNGIKVLLATGDGNKALSAIRNERPDVVILDMILPGIDGIGILEEVGSMENRPVIIIETSLHMTSLVEEALYLGADYYMMKPVSNSMLIKRMQQILRGKRMQKHAEKPREESAGIADVLVFEPRKNNEKMVHGTSKITGNNYAYSGDIEIDVTNILLEIGIPAHIKGYQYIREGIIMSYYDGSMLQYVTKSLYPSIAEKFKTTSGSVERTIRHAIEVAWRRGNLDTLERVFGNTISAGKGKPTNSEFMALLTDKIRLEYRPKNVS